MTSTFFVIGLMLASFPWYAHAQQEPATGIYERAYSLLREESASDDLPSDVALYLQAFAKSEWEMELTEEEVKRIVAGDIAGVCGNRPSNDPLENIVGCNQAAAQLRRLANDELRIRKAGQEMQAIATGFELPTSDLPGRTLQINTDLRGIISIWSAGTGSMKEDDESTIIIRTKAADPDDNQLKQILQRIGQRIGDATRDDGVGAVWRYQYGVRLVDGQRAPTFPAPYLGPNSGPTTERRFLSKRWNDEQKNLEQALMELWTYAKGESFDPPLTSKEVVYFTFPKSMTQGTLPDNVLVWARVDTSGVYSDAGLQWYTPLRPVHPALLPDPNEDAEKPYIAGGNYPPEPITVSPQGEQPLDGQGLCTSPGAKRGYLCRPYELLDPGDRCPEDDKQSIDPDAINLIHCTKDDDLRSTAAGPDVCREINWKEASFNPQTQCRVAMSCGNCNGRDASATPKNGGGNIQVCVGGGLGPSTYSAYRGLVYAAQACSKAPNAPVAGHYPGLTAKESNAVCCEYETEAYQAQCALMARDGMFDTNESKQGADGIPFNAETCAEFLANQACKSGQMKGCFTSRTYSKRFGTELVAYLNRSNPADVPASCNEALNSETMDRRVSGFEESLNRIEYVCTPTTVSEYKNRIGNNLCYIGQCIEQSMELHRSTPARVPGGVQEPIAPWDSPLAGSPLGNLVMNPPLTQGYIPLYRPQLLVKLSDAALCQLQGLPPLTPPVLCTASPSRQLALTRTNPLDTITGLLTQRTQQEAASNDVLTLMPGVGVRAGSALYTRYLSDASRSFAGILSVATELLEEMKKVTFPTQMCTLQ